MVREQGRAGEVRACMPKESGRGKGGEGVSKQRAKRAEPSLAGLPLGSLCSPIFAISPRFFPFAPSMEPGPRLCPWHALSDNQPSMFEHLLLHRKNKQLYK